MPILIVRPDNFIAPQYTIQADTGSELLQKVKNAYTIRHEHVSIHIYTSPRGYTNRTRLDTLDTLPGSDPSYAWISIHLLPVPPSTDEVA